MKVLVTGAAGFIGGQLWHTLWQRAVTYTHLTLPTTHEV